MQGAGTNIAGMLDRICVLFTVVASYTVRVENLNTGWLLGLVVSRCE